MGRMQMKFKWDISYFILNNLFAADLCSQRDHEIFVAKIDFLSYIVGLASVIHNAEICTS